MEVVVISTQKRRRKTHKRVGREIRFKSAASRPPHSSGYTQEKSRCPGRIRTSNVWYSLLSGHWWPWKITSSTALNQKIPVSPGCLVNAWSFFQGKMGIVFSSPHFLAQAPAEVAPKKGERSHIMPNNCTNSEQENHTANTDYKLENSSQFQNMVEFLQHSDILIIHSQR